MELSRAYLNLVAKSFKRGVASVDVNMLRSWGAKPSDQIPLGIGSIDAIL